ncbi:hypothetical protein diail_12054 [Diaporthe ilicicola]|nr:hypothetical protein diail_12054 [Diaporthe ilicicola]
MELAEKDNPEFWKLRDVELSYWDEYIATRPVYDERIFQPIRDFHAAHSHSHSAALDIGTGSGSAIGPLSETFEHVVASDSDPTSLNFAKHRHSNLPPGKLSFTLSRGEDLLGHHPADSFDLITCAETFPLMDTAQALNNVSALLQPGGTLAIWFYGPPFFTEDDFAPKCQPLLDSIMDHNFRPVVSGGGVVRQQSWKRAADGKASWLDYIPFDKGDWEDVQRRKWNTHARLSFFTPAACDFPVEPSNNVSEGEFTSEERDDSFWQVRWDVEMLRKFVNASFPKPKGTFGPDDTMENMFAQLADEMGGRGVERNLSWPAVLILASKKNE